MSGRRSPRRGGKTPAYAKPSKKPATPRRAPPVVELVEMPDDGEGDLDGTTVASAYHWSPQDQTRLAAAILAAMKLAFEARWVELGLAGVPLPPAAVRHLRDLSDQVAASATRTHNAAVSRFVAAWLLSWRTQHNGSLAGARGPLIDAVGTWLAARVASHGAGLASMQTLLAHSFADLYSARPGDLFTVDGPPLTDRSCPTCIAYYGTILTQKQAWALPFPAHPHCEHVLRRLSADESARVRASGRVVG